MVESTVVLSYGNEGAKERIGALIAVLGAVGAFSYTGSVITTTDPVTGVPFPTAPPIVYITLVFGPMFVTWGWFTRREGSGQPLTWKRSITAPLVAAIGSAVGIVAFATRWILAKPLTVPSDTGGQPTTWDPSVLEIVQMEFTGIHLVAIAAVSTMVAGTATARRGWSGLFALALPVAIAALVLPFASEPLGLEVVPILIVLSLLPFALGYFGARPD